MERIFIFAFDHAGPLFFGVVVLGVLVALGIGRPRRFIHWVGEAFAFGAVAVGVAALLFFGSVKGVLQERVATLSFVTEAGGVSHRIGDYRGRIVVLNYWATWCAPCRKEMPDLNRLAGAHSGGDVVVLTVSDETWEEIGRFTARFPMKTVVGRFLSEAPRGAVAAMAFQGRPTTLILDREGNVRRQFIGARDFDTFEAAVRPLLGGRRP